VACAMNLMLQQVSDNIAFNLPLNDHRFKSHTGFVDSQQKYEYLLGGLMSIHLHMQNTYRVCEII
jgi:hypothetical protein